MIKFKSLDKQLEERAKIWYLKQQPVNKKLSEEDLEYFENNKKEVIKKYLKKNPKVKEEYTRKKAGLLKIKLGLAIGTLTVGTLAGAFIHYSKQQTQENKTKQEEQLEDIIIDEEEEIKEEVKEEVQETVQEEVEENDEEESKNAYEGFFASARSIDDRYSRDDLITKKTKQIIVEAYNKENPENPITTDRLQTFILNEFVLKKTDRIGNITYERVPQNVQYEFTENQELVKMGNIYDFRIDGKTVAVFDKYGDVLPDKNVQKPDMAFRKMIPMLDKASKLKETYKYISNDAEKTAAEEDYRREADIILNIVNNDKNKDVIKEGNEI